jgi:hypothetical protein
MASRPAAVLQQAIEGEPGGNSDTEKNDRMGPGALERAGGGPPEGVARTGCMNETLGSPAVLFASVDREVVAFVVAMPLEVHAVSREAGGNEPFYGSVGGLS